MTSGAWTSNERWRSRSAISSRRSDGSLAPLVLRDELADKGDPHASVLLSSRRFSVADKREDLTPTTSTSSRAYLGIDVAKLKLDAVLLLEE